MRSIINTLGGAALWALAMTPATAEEVTFTGHFGALAVGQITTLTPTHVFWAGAFSGSVFDAAGGPFDRVSVTCPGTNDLDFGAGTSVMSGYCVVSDGADSTIVATWECAGTPGSCEGTGTWADGTGKWQGWTADATFTAQLGKTHEDGTTSTTAVWTVTYRTP
ncbi:MAG: hypothetical protein ACT4N9_00200 [Paracoccaceae bacterium]